MEINQTINGKKEGYWEFNSGGRLVKASYKNGVYHGLVSVYYDNGRLLGSSNCIMGVKNGLEKLYSSNGRILTERYYENGNRVIDIIFHPNGNVKEEIIYGKKTVYKNTGILNRNK